MPSNAAYAKPCWLSWAAVKIQNALKKKAYCSGPAIAKSPLFHFHALKNLSGTVFYLLSAVSIQFTQDVIWECVAH